MLFSALALGAESHVCDTHTCDTTARTAQELRNTCPSGQDGMIKQFTHFSSTGTSTGCYQSGSNLYAVGGPHWGGGHCAWTSEKVQITHPHEFEQLYVKFQSADYGNLESTDYQQVELRTCKANNMQACSPWSRTVHVNDDVHGWTWTWINSDAKTATSSRQQNVFADKVGWTARNTRSSKTKDSYRPASCSRSRTIGIPNASSPTISRSGATAPVTKPGASATKKPPQRTPAPAERDTSALELTAQRALPLPRPLPSPLPRPLPSSLPKHPQMHPQMHPPSNSAGTSSRRTPRATMLTYATPSRLSRPRPSVCRRTVPWLRNRTAGSA